MTELAPALDTSAVPEGSNLLVVGPAMTGKRELPYEVLAADRGSTRATGLVTTRNPADQVAMGYRERHPGVHSLAIVDCVTRRQGFSGGQTTRERRFGSAAGTSPASASRSRSSCGCSTRTPTSTPRASGCTRSRRS